MTTTTDKREIEITHHIETAKIQLAYAIGELRVAHKDLNKAHRKIRANSRGAHGIMRDLGRIESLIEQCETLRKIL